MAVVLVAAVNLSAQTLSVAYMEGQAELQTTAGVTELSIGDRVPRDATLKIGDQGYVELAGQGFTIVCSQPGSYSVQALLTASQRAGVKESAQVVTSMLSKLVYGAEKNQGTAMGMRGANESKADQPDWVESDTEAHLDSGKSLIGAGKYSDAVEELQEALQSADEREQPEVRYYLASAYSLGGDVRDSLKQLSQVTVSGGEAWAPDYVLLKARLLVDTNAFQQEISWLTGQGGELPRDALRAPLYYFLLALGYQGTGDVANEKDSLSQVVKMAAGSTLGDTAVRMLEQL